MAGQILDIPPKW